MHLPRYGIPLQRTDLSNVPVPTMPGTFGVAHGSGPIADVIRRATESWAGHAVVYVGNGEVVEARWPKVVLGAAPRSNVLWATGQSLTEGQRNSVVNVADHLVGDGYDWSVYPALVAAVFYAGVTKDLKHLFDNDKWWDCSGLVAHCYKVAGVDLFPETSPHLVTPAQLLQLGTQNGWFQGL